MRVSSLIERALYARDAHARISARRRARKRRTTRDDVPRTTRDDDDDAFDVDVHERCGGAFAIASASSTNEDSSERPRASETRDLNVECRVSSVECRVLSLKS